MYIKDFFEFMAKYRILFDRILDGYKFDHAFGDEYYYVNANLNKIKMIVSDTNIVVFKKNNEISSVEVIELPEEGDEYLKTIEKVTEERVNGTKKDEIIRFYGKIENDDYYVTDLYQITKCVNKNSQTIQSSFEVHMKDNKTRFNNKDITYIYMNVSGPLKVEKIYNLYNGIEYLVADELEKIECGLLDEICFDYKRINGVKSKEDAFIGDSKIKKRFII